MDLANHSPQIWRSFYVEMDCHDTDQILEICNFLKRQKIRFSFQRYSRVGTEEHVLEPEHVSFRLLPNNEADVTLFRKYLQGKYKHDVPENIHKFTEGSWDEEWHTKKAYEIATKFYLIYAKEMDELRGYPKIRDMEKFKHFMMHLIHGFFNNLNTEYRDERRVLVENLRFLVAMEGNSEAFMRHVYEGRL